MPPPPITNPPPPQTPAAFRPSPPISQLSQAPTNHLPNLPGAYLAPMPYPPVAPMPGMFGGGWDGQGPGLYYGEGVCPPPGLETAVQIATLQQRLDRKLGPEYISTRAGPGGAGKLTYIEGWKVINIANEVFGFNGWSSSIVRLDTDFIDLNPSTNRYTVGVSAIMRITLRDGTWHEDVGYGEAMNVKEKGAALDKCKKEAITDAIKRTLRSFGNVLGNCLYDKEYSKEVNKMKVPAPKWDPKSLYRRPEYDEFNSRAGIMTDPQPSTGADVVHHQPPSVSQSHNQQQPRLNVSLARSTTENNHHAANAHASTSSSPSTNKPIPMSTPRSVLPEKQQHRGGVPPTPLSMPRPVPQAPSLPGAAARAAALNNNNSKSNKPMQIPSASQSDDFDDMDLSGVELDASMYLTESLPPRSTSPDPVPRTTSEPTFSSAAILSSSSSPASGPSPLPDLSAATTTTTSLNRPPHPQQQQQQHSDTPNQTGAFSTTSTADLKRSHTTASAAPSTSIPSPTASDSNNNCLGPGPALVRHLNPGAARRAASLACLNNHSNSTVSSPATRAPLAELGIEPLEAVGLTGSGGFVRGGVLLGGGGPAMKKARIDYGGNGLVDGRGEEK